MFQRLQFKNMLSRFDVETVSNQIEDVFREVTDPEEIKAVFREAAQAERVGAAFSKDPEMYFLCLPIRRDSGGSPLHGERTVLSRFPVIWIRTWKRCSGRCQRLPGK